MGKTKKPEKTSLTPDDAIKAGYADMIHGTSQHEIKTLLGVNNPGRVGEAVVAMRYAAENFSEIYKVATKKKKIVDVEDADG